MKHTHMVKSKKSTKSLHPILQSGTRSLSTTWHSVSFHNQGLCLFLQAGTLYLSTTWHSVSFDNMPLCLFNRPATLSFSTTCVPVSLSTTCRYVSIYRSLCLFLQLVTMSLSTGPCVSFYNLALCLNSIYSLASCFILQPATNVAVYNLPLCIFKNSFLVISFHRYYAVKLCSAIPHLYNSLDLLLSAYHVTPLLYCSAFT